MCNIFCVQPLKDLLGAVYKIQAEHILLCSVMYLSYLSTQIYEFIWVYMLHGNI